MSLGNGKMSNGLLRATGKRRRWEPRFSRPLLSYAVNVLEARKLKATVGNLNLGNVLRGASVSTSFTVTSTNSESRFEPHDDGARGAGGTPLGALDGRARPSISAGGLVNVPLTGTLNTYGSVSVKSCAAGGYGGRPLGAGLHELPQPRRSDTRRTWASRSSAARRRRSAPARRCCRPRVAAGLAIDEPVLESQSEQNARGESDPRIVGDRARVPCRDSTGPSAARPKSSRAPPVAATRRLPCSGASGFPARRMTPGRRRSTTLPAGGWLTSDVVKIGGVAADATYALQMSFDDRINLALDGPTNGTVANEFPNLYLAEFDNSMNQWVNAATLGTIGLHAQQAVFDSLTDFLAATQTTPLDQLQGSWGVDPATSPTGIGEAWAIVSGVGSGIFAVDPGNSLHASVGRQQRFCNRSGTFHVGAIDLGRRGPDRLRLAAMGTKVAICRVRETCTLPYGSVRFTHPT